MTDDVASLVPEQLRIIRNEASSFRTHVFEQFQDVELRLGNLEETVALQAASIARLTVRVDRIDSRLDRIERRPDLVDVPHP